MNRSTDPLLAPPEPEPIAPATTAAKPNSAPEDSAPNSTANASSATPNAPSAPSNATPHKPLRPATRRRQALWASLLGAGALGALGVALWTRSSPAPSTPPVVLSPSSTSPTSATASATASATKSAASIFGLPESDKPASDLPLFPGLKPGAPGKSSAAATGRADSAGSAQASPSGVLPNSGATPGAGAGGPSALGKPGGSVVPGPVQAAFARAVEAQKAGRVEEAVRDYREVLRLKPDAVEARANLAILFAGQKQPEKAVEQLEAARKLAPRQPAILFQLAQARLQAKRPKEAVEPLQAVVKIDPKNPAPQLLLAQVLTQLGRTGPALQAWERLCALDPKNSGAALAAGAMALEGAKEPERAAKWLRKAVALAPSDAREPLLLGRALMAAKKPKEAAAVLKRGFAQFPQAIELGTLLADARVASNDMSGAIGALREVIKRVPEEEKNGAARGQLHIALARMLAGQKKFAPAQAALSEAAQLLPRDADVRGLSVDVALKAGDWDTATRSLDEMISLDSKRFPARLLVAREAARRKQLAVADAQYARYLAQKRDDAGAVAERAVVLEKMGRTDDADAQWKRAVVLLPDNPLPALQRARALHQARREKQALEAYRFVLQNWSSDPNALLATAELEMKLGQPARATGRWRALIKVRPSFEPAYASLLEASRQVDQMPSALGFLKQQVSRNAERPALYEAVLNVHARLGRAGEGRAWVANISRLYPSARAPRQALAEFARRFPSLAREGAPPAAAPRASPKTTPNDASATPIESPATPAKSGAGDAASTSKSAP